MPNDLLQYVIGPSPYASVWLWVASAALVALAAWYAAILIKKPPARGLPAALLGGARDEMNKRLTVHAIRTLEKRYRAGELATASAAAALGAEVRRYLQESTGIRARYMHISAVQAGRLAPAAPVLSDIVDVQFNQHSRVDLAVTCAAAEELVRRWT